MAQVEKRKAQENGEVLKRRESEVQTGWDSGNQGLTSWGSGEQAQPQV